ncbi:anti-sigma factor antagonist [Streptomyces sp. XM83C]|uniref:Anti-sigma factor antagonist n=1 Tax=Streptomyces thermocoprophilus TaxID=78356 RepID=A0ABV5V7L8_9ACTN|nr:anti-sigma factor antagonist [Streptomyces sp. XM83C]MCK1819705.1 anti-sigma factor antagonist [Streptomyces sp. XM83C]
MQHEPAARSPHLRTREAGGYTVLEFAGEIDIAAAVEIQPSLDAATEGPAPRVVIDLTDIEFFDCSGLRLLYRARRRVLDHDGRIHLVCTHPLTLRVLRLTGLGKLLPPQATLEAALALPEAASGTL